MRRLLILVILLTAAPAQAWEPPAFRHAIDRDMREGAGHDRWAITAVDPRGTRTLRMRFGATGGDVYLDWGEGGEPLTYGNWRPVPIAGPGLRRERIADPSTGVRPGTVELRRARDGWRLRGHVEGSLEFDLRIRSRGPGPTFVSRHPDAGGLLRRAMPMIDGAATGHMLMARGAERRRLRGWRTTIVHDWWADDGHPPCCPTDRPIPYPRCCQDASVAVVYGTGSATALVGGSTEVTNGGDDRWSGFIAHRAGGRLQWCRAKRHRQVYVSGWGPHTLDASCGGRRVHLRLIEKGPFLRWNALAPLRTRNAFWLYRSDWTTQHVQ